MYAQRFGLLKRRTESILNTISKWQLAPVDWCIQYDSEYFELCIHISKTCIFIFPIAQHISRATCTIVYYCRKMKQYIFITGETYSDNHCSPDGHLILVFSTGSTAIKNINMYVLETCMCSQKYSGSYCITLLQKCVK